MLFLFVASALIMGSTAVFIELNSTQEALCKSCGFLEGPTCCCYYKCDLVLNIAILKYCPHPTVWHHAELICDWPYNVRPECGNDDACYGGTEASNGTCPQALVDSLNANQCCQNLVIYTKLSPNTYQVSHQPIERCAEGQIFTLDGCYCEYPYGAPRTLPCLYWSFTEGIVEEHQNLYTDPGGAFISDLFPKRGPYITFNDSDPMHIPGYVSGTLGSQVTIIWFGKFRGDGLWVYSDTWSFAGRTRGVGRKKRQLGGIEPLGGDGDIEEELAFQDSDGTLVAGPEDEESLRTLAGGTPKWKLYAVTWCDGVRTVYINNRIVGTYTSFGSVDVELGKSGLNFGGGGLDADMDEILICRWCFDPSEIIEYWISGEIPPEPIPEIYTGK